MSRSPSLAPLLFIMLVSRIEFIEAADELPPAATLLDDKTIMYLRPAPLVSPDGRFVAYVSRGQVCVADVAAGYARKLVEVPDAWSHVYASSEETSDGGDANTLGRLLHTDKHKELQDRVTSEIGEFQWTADSAAIIFGVRSHNVDATTTSTYFVRVPLDSAPTVIASSEHSLTKRPSLGGVITRDGRYLVGNHGRYRSLIWDLATNKPRATPFLYLASSPTSGRWIGVEKDTRELLVVDEDFNVIDRHPEVMPDNKYGFDMIWSPDERFAFWRQQIGFDYYSNWVGCRYDLQTHERQIFTGDYMAEQLAFTGHRGEVLRVGTHGVRTNHQGLELVEQYIGLVPDGHIHLRSFWYQRPDPSETSLDVGVFSNMSNVVWSHDFQLFVVGFPRKVAPHGEVLHLVDRQRHIWKLPGKDAGQYISPYNVAGFALDGKSIIAYDATRLFSIPVTAVQTLKNKLR